MFLQLCGVGPGRVLELCSSLHQPSSSGGRLEDHVGSHESHMIQQQQRLSTSLPAGGYLRSARLYPLGIVETPPIQPSECLGIVSSKPLIVLPTFTPCMQPQLDERAGEGPARGREDQG